MPEVNKEIRYAHCRCKVWPLFFLQPIGHCGRCGAKPFSMFYETEEEAQRFYEAWLEGQDADR